MKAVDTPLLTLLKAANQFVVPIYQRTYSWEETESAQLWSDIIRAGRDSKLGSHFTGSIVYVARDESTKTAAEPDLIIDGQQRVTTVTLLLAALAQHLETLPESEREPVYGFSPKKIRGRYLLNQDEDGERQFKLLLSQGDKDTLMSLLQKVEPSAPVAERVYTNFQYFRDRLKSAAVNLEEVCRGLEKLVVVEVTLTRNMDNPQLVFESMNSTGKKLTQADLIRNFVLMDLEPKTQNHLYTQYWRPMEVDLGPATQASRFDDFVRHYLTVMTGDIPRQTDIYDAFKEYAEAHIRGDQSIEVLVSDLRDYSKRYCAMALGGEPDTRLNSAFRDLEQIRADVVYPFLLEAYTDYEVGTLSRDELLEIVQTITSYIFRRAVCRIPTNSLNTTFSGFGKALRKDRYLDSVKAHFLAMPAYRRFPTDAEFDEALRTSDLYHFKRRSYFLRMMENHDRKEHVSTESYTIEHIMPQNNNLSAEWQAALGPAWQEIQQRWLHTLGNLTLTGYNSEYSDKPFTEKRDMKDGFADSPLRLNKDLGTLDTWNEQEISDRAQRLATEAVKIWRRPELPDQAVTEFQQPRSETGFSIEDHPNLLPPVRRELFEKFSEEVSALDPGVTRQFRKLYVAFKSETNFVDVVPQVAHLRLSLNLPFAALHDERRLATDVSGKGRWGNGPTQVTLNEKSDFAYVIGLVRQAYEYQLDSD